MAANRYYKCTCWCFIMQNGENYIYLTRNCGWRFIFRNRVDIVWTVSFILWNCDILPVLNSLCVDLYVAMFLNVQVAALCVLCPYHPQLFIKTIFYQFFAQQQLHNSSYFAIDLYGSQSVEVRCDCLFSLHCFLRYRSVSRSS